MTSPAHLVNSSELTLWQRLKHFNSMLVFFTIYMACCAFNFGFDVATFGGVQAMQSFASKFGEYNAEQDLWALPAWLASVMTATPFLGKAVGCIVCGWIAEKFGRRAAVLILCLISFVGVIIQTTSTTAAQFTVGRVCTFFMTGMAIVLLPLYQAEVAPRVLRGSIASTTQVLIIFGSLVSTLITYGTKDIPSKRGWQIPIVLQIVMPATILLLMPFIPESPRWLLSQDRRLDAVQSLRRFRKGATDKAIELEIDAIQFANENEHKGPWSEVFDQKNRVRTWVAILAMFGQQITGQAFPSQYGTIFYQSQGFRSKAFLFNVVSQIVSLVAVLFTFLYVDSIGRRKTLLVGGSAMGAALFVLGGIGSVSKSQLNMNERNVMVAALQLFSFFYNLSWAPVSYVVVSEAAALRVKEKTTLLACVVAVLTTFVTSFTCPYLINSKYANLGGKVGYIYGSFNVACVVLVYFFIPELKGRTLEEVDQLFESGVALRRFHTVRTKTAEEMYRDALERNEVVTSGDGKAPVESDGKQT